VVVVPIEVKLAVPVVVTVRPVDHLSNLELLDWILSNRLILGV
jgi:hypothetical protein